MTESVRLIFRAVATESFRELSEAASDLDPSFRGSTTHYSKSSEEMLILGFLVPPTPNGDEVAVTVALRDGLPLAISGDIVVGPQIVFDQLDTVDSSSPDLEQDIRTFCSAFAASARQPLLESLESLALANGTCP